MDVDGPFGERALLLYPLTGFKVLPNYWASTTSHKNYLDAWSSNQKMSGLGYGNDGVNPHMAAYPSSQNATPW